MIEQLKAWAVVIVGVPIAIATIVFTATYTVPCYLDHWDKARAQTGIEVKDMVADADMLRAKRIQAGIVNRR